LKLRHYTLNTGLIKELHRQPLSRRTRRTLTDLAARGGGEFSGILSAYACRIEPGVGLGGREFWILRNGDPVLLSVVCREERAAAEAFGIAERAYLDLFLARCVAGDQDGSTICDHAPAAPDAVPWLARVWFPAGTGLEARELVVLDELERCLAWTLLKSTPVLH
jgi:hypothetical protein